MAMVRGCVLPSMQISRACLLYLKTVKMTCNKCKKTSLEACFNSSLGNRDKDLRFCQNFLRRKKASMTDEQQKVVDEWEEKICGDGAGLCPAIDADFTRLLIILENRQDDLQQMQKTSLEACFNSSLSNTDKDLNFCKNFFKRKKASMTDEQQKVVDEWEEIICADGCADFARLFTILENREDDLREMRKTSLEACFQTRVSNADNDLGFGRNFFRRQKDRLTDEQRKVLEDWSSKICCHEPVDDGFRRFLSTLHARAQELSALRKCDLKGIFSSHICKTDTELKFCQNFWRRSAEKLSPEQTEQVEDLTAEILWPHAQDDRAALRPAVVRMLDKFENILARREAEFRGFGAASVHGLFTGHAKKSDSEVRFCYDFVSRVFPKLEESEQQRLRIKLDDLLLKSCCVPVKSSYQAKLHDAETVLGDVLPRPRLPKSLRQLFGNSMDAEARIMPFLHRVHEVLKACFVRSGVAPRGHRWKHGKEAAQGTKRRSEQPSR